MRPTYQGSIDYHIIILLFGENIITDRSPGCLIVPSNSSQSHVAQTIEADSVRYEIYRLSRSNKPNRDSLIEYVIEFQTITVQLSIPIIMQGELSD